MRPRKRPNYNEVFAKNVKTLRENKGLTQKELAENILGYKEEYISKIEEGLSIEVNISFYIDLVNYFNLSINQLFTEIQY